MQIKQKPQKQHLQHRLFYFEQKSPQFLGAFFNFFYLTDDSILQLTSRCRLLNLNPLQLCFNCNKVIKKLRHCEERSDAAIYVFRDFSINYVEKLEIQLPRSAMLHKLERWGIIVWKI